MRRAKCARFSRLTALDVASGCVLDRGQLALAGDARTLHGNHPVAKRPYPLDPVRPPASLRFPRLGDEFIQRRSRAVASPVLIFAAGRWVDYTGDMARSRKHKAHRTGKLFRDFPDAFGRRDVILPSRLN